MTLPTRPVRSTGSQALPFRLRTTPLALLAAALLAGCGKPETPASAPIPSPQARQIDLAAWGTLQDPIGDVGVETNGTALTLSLPPGIRDLSGIREQGGNAAPRTLQEVEGDFTVTVQVTGDFNPPPKPDANAFNGAGILVFDANDHYLRLERNVWTSPNGARANYAPLFEYWQKGAMLSEERGTPEPFFRGRSTHLRLTRKGNEITAAVSHDGSVWEETNQVTTEFPARVKVGICAINTAAAPFRVEFAHWSLRKGGK